MAGYDISHEEMSTDCVQRYIQLRKAIDTDLQFIGGLAGVLAQYEQAAQDHSMEVDPVKIGVLHSVIEQRIQAIQQSLDDFLSVKKAEISLGFRNGS